MLLSIRELLVEHRTRLANCLRGHAAEFGIVAPLGDKGLAQVLSDAARCLQPAAEGLRCGPSSARSRSGSPRYFDRQVLAEVPGIGPVSALNLATRVDFSQFKSGRHFAAWLGLTPKDHSSGGKLRLGGISRAGDERLRQLLVLGATAVIRHAKPGKASEWLLKLLARKPRKLAAVALANKMARVVWAMMTSGEAAKQEGLTRSSMTPV